MCFNNVWYNQTPKSYYYIISWLYGINMIISQLSIAPIGEGTSLSKYVKIAIDSIKKNNVNFKTNDMATVIETDDLKTLFKIVEDAHNAVLKTGTKRIITELKIDDRRDKNIRIGTKVKAIE